MLGEPTIDAYDGYTSNEQAAATVLLILMAFTAFLALVVAANYLLTAIPLAALFRKTGVESWKAWVPVLNTYTWLRLGGQNGNWAWASLVPYGGIVTTIFVYMGMHRTGRAFGKDAGFLVLGIFLPWVWLAILGFGRAEYRPETLAAEGYGPPLVGYGAARSPHPPRGQSEEYTAIVYPPPAPREPAS